MPRGRSFDNGEPAGRHRKVVKTPSGIQRSADFVGWINVNIPKADQASVDEFSTSPEFVDALGLLLRSHHRLTLIWNERDECYQANSFCMNEQSPNAGLMISARSTDASRAVVKLVYIHDRLLPEDYSQSGEEDGSW